MKEQFVPYEIAKQLKQKGFNGQSMGYYDNYGLLHYKAFSTVIKVDSASLFAPLWQQVIDWFRDKYSINIWVTNWSKVIRDEFGHKEYESCVRLKDYMRLSYSKYFDSYPEARQAAIEHALTLI